MIKSFEYYKKNFCICDSRANISSSINNEVDKQDIDDICQKMLDISINKQCNNYRLSILNTIECMSDLSKALQLMPPNLKLTPESTNDFIAKYILVSYYDIYFDNRNIHKCIKNYAYDQFYNIRGLILKTDFSNLTKIYPFFPNNNIRNATIDINDDIDSIKAYIDCYKSTKNIKKKFDDDIIFYKTKSKYVYNNKSDLSKKYNKSDNDNIDFDYDFFCQLLCFYKECYNDELTITDNQKKYIIYYTILSKNITDYKTKFINIKHIAVIINNNSNILDVSFLNWNGYISIIKKYALSKDILRFQTIVSYIINKIYINKYCDCLIKNKD